VHWRPKLHWWARWKDYSCTLQIPKLDVRKERWEKIMEKKTEGRKGNGTRSCSRKGESNAAVSVGICRWVMSTSCCRLAVWWWWWRAGVPAAATPTRCVCSASPSPRPRCSSCRPGLRRSTYRSPSTSRPPSSSSLARSTTRVVAVQHADVFHLSAQSAQWFPFFSSPLHSFPHTHFWFHVNWVCCYWSQWWQTDLCDDSICHGCEQSHSV